MDDRDERNFDDADAQREIDAERDRVTEIASELRRRARPEYVKVQLGGAIVKKTTDMKSRAVRSPVVLGLAGALIGVAAARIIRGATAGSRKERIEWETDGDEPETWDNAGEIAAEVKGRAADLKDRAADLKDRASDAVAEAKDKVGRAASEIKDRVVETAEQVKERLPSLDTIKDRAGSAYRWTTDEQPVVGGMIAFGLGMALGFLLPVTEPEERVLEGVRHRAAENLGDLQDKVRELSDRLDEKIAGESQRPQG
jgi:methyl-accepting chemotaxis protein